MAKATARHILVETEQQCNTLKDQISQGMDFGEAAKQHSKCPSGASGGELGEFGPGMMVKEFDQVVFSAPINEVQGPVRLSLVSTCWKSPRVRINLRQR